jgi:DNA-binding NarL/FixJ family response regulator
MKRLIKTQPSLQLVGAVNGTLALRSVIADSDPDVILVHLESQSPEPDWKELTLLNVPVVLLADDLDVVSLMAAFSNGVRAILVGEVSAAELVAAVQSTAVGLLTLSVDLADLACQGLLAHLREESDDSAGDHTPMADGSPERLTQREREVLEMMTEGLANKEIAAQLNISVHTVKFHISSILGKLGASTRTEAVANGLRRGLVTI